MEIERIEQRTKELIDALKQTCNNKGLGNGGDEYRIVIEIFLYKYFNDKFGYEAKRCKSPYQQRLANTEHWDAEYDTFTQDEYEELFDFLPAGTPLLKPEHTLAHLYNAIQQGDSSTLLDNTLVAISALNEDIFSVRTEGGSKTPIFKKITTVIDDEQSRDDFARALMSKVANFNFEEVFAQKYDFFSTIFEYLIKDYNKDGGGKYAEYYTPKSIARIIARLLVGDQKNLRNVSCYDPSAGTGTLLMALAHEIGEDKCSIYAQDISEKSSLMLRMNLVLNNLVHSMPNIVRGNTLLHPGHLNADGTLRQFDYISNNPPFNLDFSDERDDIAHDTYSRFFAGVPNVPNKDKNSMAIYTCFIQHILSVLSDKGRAAIVVPTGFITSKSGIGNKILKKAIDEKLVFGCVSMPSNVFATTGTNVSVVFFDKTKSHDKIVLIDASKLGEDYQDGNNKRHRLTADDEDLIVSTFMKGAPVEDFCATPTYDEVKEKGCSLSAGQYFDIKIEYIDITPEQFEKNMAEHKKALAEMFAEGKRLEDEIMVQLNKLGM